MIASGLHVLQEPVLRTVCNRTAFQEASSNHIRVSLDCDVFMMRERGAHNGELAADPGSWCRSERWVQGRCTASWMPTDKLFVPLMAAHSPIGSNDINFRLQS